MLTQKSSIAHQKSYFEKYVRERGWQLYKVYEDIESGMSVKKREGLKRLIEDCQRGFFEILLTKSISRFARNTLEGLKYIREFKKKGIRFITIEDAFDSDQYDEFMFTLLLSMAQKESEKISQRIKFGKNQRANKGLYNGSNPPYGYKKAGKNDLIPAGDITTEVVKLIFKMYIQGEGLYKIAKYLNKKGYPTPSMAAGKTNNNNLWHQSTIKNILTNEIYIGNMVQNKSKTKDLLNGIREANSKEEYIRVNNTHKAIIDDKSFELVQRILKKRRRKITTTGKHLFTNILYCGHCNSRLHYKKNKSSYICGRVNKMGKSSCRGCYIKEEELKGLIEKDLMKLIGKNVDLDRFNEKLKVEIKKNQNTNQFISLDKEIKNTVKRKNRLLDIFIEGLITKEEFNSKNMSIENEITLLQENKAGLELYNNRQIDIESYNKLYEYIKLDSIVVNKLIRKITIYNACKIEVIYNFGNKNIVYN